MKTVLASYANNATQGISYYDKPEQFVRNQELLNESALRAGIDEVVAWNPAMLEGAGYVYKYGRPAVGDGYFSWKSFVVLQTLLRHPDAIVIYYDSGRHDGHKIDRFPATLIDWCLAHDGMLPGVYIPCWGPNRRWTTRDCFVYMGCDSEPYWNAPQVQATFSIWQGKRAVEFVQEWWDYCNEPKVCAGLPPNVCGLPNLDGFVGHRHDQSVVTNLCVKYNLPALKLVDSVHGDTAKNINVCNTKDLIVN